MDTTVIVGAGPAGLAAAIRLRELGWQATVLEEHRGVGEPENCTGLISRSGAEELKLDLEGCLVNSVKGADLISPDGTTLSIKKKGDTAFVIDRKAFDRSLYRKALGAGARIELNTKLIDIRGNTLFIKKKKRGEVKKAQAIIGADGVDSAVRAHAGYEVPENYFVHTYQERAEGSFDQKRVKMYFGSFAPGFFGWVVPESGGIARIGAGCSIGKNPKDAFDAFTKHAGLEFRAISRGSFLIPVGPPLKSFVDTNILLAGDAAFQAKATTGGGIILGMMAARECAEAVSEHLKNSRALSAYDKNAAGISKELRSHWKIRSFLNSQNDEKLDKLFLKLKNAGIEEFLAEHGDMDKPSRFVSKILRKPGMWKLAGLAMKFR